MSEFWIWFWRPIAEFLGAMALIFGICVLFAIYVFVYEFFNSRALKKKKEQK